MATAPSNPTVRRLELAARLRDLRQAASKSMEEVATELMCSAAKISRLETGERGILPRDVRDLCRFYGVSDVERDRLIRLAEESRKPGWWQDFRGLDQRAATFVALESAATEIRFTHAMIIPGLLQTTDYARALVPLLRPPGGMPPEAVEAAVRLRERRQLRVLAGEVIFLALVDEAAFRRMVGSPSIMLAQIERLLELGGLDNVTVQVIPFDAGPHPLLEGQFQLMHLGARLSDVVFVEGLLGTFLIDDTQQVRDYSEIWEHISCKVALSAADTIAWLGKEERMWRHQAEAGVKNK